MICMYKISAQLCKVMNEPSKPFGGLNILFAGDFAQLAPPVGGESVALYSRTVKVAFVSSCFHSMSLTQVT